MSATDADRWRHLAPVHSWRTTATIVLVLVPLIAIGSIMYRGRHSADLPNLKAPKGASAAPLPAPTTVPASLAGIPLPGVDGTTTIPKVRLVGDAKIGGTVSGPNGPVPGAVVHAERIDGGYTNDFTTGADAKYLFENLPGGRYRVRAFLAPAYAQTKPDVAFLGADEARVLDVKMDQFGTVAVTSALAPSPPMVGQPFNLVVRVAKRTVDATGVVRATPVPGATVALSSTGTLQLSGSNSATTTSDGTVTYLSGCKGAGALSVTATVRLTAADVPTSVPLDLPPCEGAATTTTAPRSSTTTTTTATTTKPQN